MKLRKLLTYSILVLLTIPISGLEAQENVPVVLSLDSCKALSMKNQASLKNSDIEVRMAEQTKKAAFTKYFPAISATGVYYKFKDPLIDINSAENDYDVQISHNGQPVGSALEPYIARLSPILSLVGIDVQTFVDNLLNGYSIEGQFIDNGYVIAVTAIQPIFAGGRIVNGNRLAKLGVEAARYQNETSSKDVLLKTEQNYWLVVSLLEKEKTVNRFLALLDTLYRDVDVAYNSGIVTKNDLLKVKLKQNEVRSTQITLKNGIALATMSLCQYIGIPYSENIVLSDTLTGTIDGPWDLKTDFAKAVSQRTEYKLLDLNVKAEKLKKKMIVGEALPQIGVGATYLGNNVLGNNTTNAVVFATATVPLTAWWETGHNIKKQNLKIQIAQNNLDNYNELLQLQLQKTWNEVEDAFNLIKIKKEAVEEAEENLASVKNYYDAGMVSLSELLEAQTVLQQSHDQYTEQCITYKVKLLEYNQMLNL